MSVLIDRPSGAITPQAPVAAQPDSGKPSILSTLTGSIADVANANEQLNMLTYSYGLTNNLQKIFSRMLSPEK